MARAVGLDIGSRAIKVVELSGSAKAFKVQRVVVREIPEPQPGVEGEPPRDPDEVISGIVREVFDSLKLPRDDVCAAFDSGSTVFREIVVPFTDEDQIRKVVKFEAENHLHSYAIEDVVVNWIKTGESRDGSRLSIFASPKVGLERLVRILRDADIEPASVDLDTTAVFTACDAAGVFEDASNVVLIDVGARSTSLILVAGRRPVTMRSFLLGADHVGSRVSKDLHVGIEEGRRRARLSTGAQAEDLLVPAAVLSPPEEEADKSLTQIQDEAVEDQRMDFVRKLHRESIRSLASLHADAAPDRILLSGGGSLLPGLDEALQERFDLPVERVDLSRNVEFKDLGPEPVYAKAAVPAAVGCGLRLLGHDPFGVELLQDEFAPTNRFDVLKTALATCVTLLFLVLLLLAFVATKRRDAEQKRYRYVAARAESLYRTAELAYLQKVENKTEQEAQEMIDRSLSRAPRDETRGRWFRSRLRRRFDKLQSELGLRRDIPAVKSSLKVWLEVIRALNKVPRGEYGTPGRQHLRIMKMDVKQRGATVRVEVDDEGAFDKIRYQFENSPYFKERARGSRVVEVGAMNRVSGKWHQEFEFKFREDD